MRERAACSGMANAAGASWSSQELHMILRTLFGCALALSIVTTAWSQAYPTKPIRFIVPFAPGGSTDTLARVLSHHLSDSLGQQVIVDNRTGGNGNIGMEIAAKAPPDGHTIVLG